MSANDKKKGKGAIAPLALLALAAVLLLGSALALAAGPQPASFQFGTANTRLKGEIRPEGKTTTWRFEYISDALYQQNIGNSKPPFEGATAAGSGATSEPISVEGRIDPTTLSPSTTYHVRLFAENADGSAAVGSQFTSGTQAPTPITTGTSHLNHEHAILEGTVNPNGDPSAYWFQVGTANCESNPCTAVPASEEGPTYLPPNGTQPYSAAQLLGNLAPETTYHFRILAENTRGVVAGEDKTFTTPPASTPEACPNEALREAQHATYLPNCRAYEMVSPSDKNGGNLIANTRRTRAAADGSAIQFQSLTPFGDTQGSNVSTEYVAIRSTEGPGPNGTGWVTHSITPYQDALTFSQDQAALATLYVGEFTPDLGAGVFFATTPLTEEPDVANVPNFYLRTDLRTSGPGSYELLTACPLCREIDEAEGEGKGALRPANGATEAAERRPRLAALTPNGHKALFESTLRLTADTPASSSPHLYEAEGGAVRLAGRIPTGTAATCDDAAGPVCKLTGALSSIAGQGASNGVRTAHVLSDGSDGHSRVFFTAEPAPVGAVGYGGRLYVREDGHYTSQLNAPEGVSSSFSRAFFQDASANGERAFFTTNQRLTEDASDSEQKLYMYDASKPGSDPHNLTFVSADNEPSDGTNSSVNGVVGASANGSYVYFIAFGQLVAGAPPVYKGLYLWHEGTLSFVSAGGGDSVIGSSFDFPGSRVTPDGTRLLFPNYVDKTGQLFLYDASKSTPTEPDVVCVSCPPSGLLPKKSASDGVIAIHGATGNGGEHENHPLSNDGRHVFFNTAEALVPEDTNGRADAYEYDSVTEEVHLLSSGTDEEPSWFMDASADGSNAFIMTEQRLVGWDKGTDYDLYDVRVGGGFPEPTPHSAPCGSAETCKESLATVPGVAPVGSGIEGPGNPAPKRVSCPRGSHAKKVKGRTVCVKPKRHHKKNRARK